MKLLLFQAKSFGWAPHERTLDSADPEPPSGEVEEAVVAFIHAEKHDEEDRPRTVRRTIKNLKWLAKKRPLETVVLHSFAHLGGENADAAWTLAFFDEVRERLESVGYRVETTPFGWFSSWHIDVYGESLAKVFQEF